MELTINTENSCRICMLSECVLLSVFEEHEGRPISELITEISGIKIEDSDLLSKKICKECELKVFELHAFRQLCIDSDETVRYNLMLADESDSLMEVRELIVDETVKTEGDEMSQLEEFFIEDEEVATNCVEEDHTEYDELFINDDETEGEHLLDDTGESIDSFDRKNIVIERVDSKSINSTPFEQSDELTMKMREAHYAKEQQKKHKCPFCDKSFMFPSKGSSASFKFNFLLKFFYFQSPDTSPPCTRTWRSRRSTSGKITTARSAARRS